MLRWGAPGAARPTSDIGDCLGRFSIRGRRRANEKKSEGIPLVVFHDVTVIYTSLNISLLFE